MHKKIAIFYFISLSIQTSNSVEATDEIDKETKYIRNRMCYVLVLQLKSEILKYYPSSLNFYTYLVVAKVTYIIGN